MELTLSFICTPLSPSVHPKPFDNLPAFLLAICSSQNMNFFLSYLTMEFLNILLFYFCCMKGRIYSWNLPAPPPTQMLQKFLGVNVQVYTQKLLGFQHHKLWKLKIVPNKIFSSSIFKKQKKNWRQFQVWTFVHRLTFVNQVQNKNGYRDVIMSEKKGIPSLGRCYFPMTNLTLEGSQILDPTYSLKFYKSQEISEVKWFMWRSYVGMSFHYTRAKMPPK